MSKVKTMPICPFWNPQNNLCEVKEGGLFIPLEDHISIYCTKPTFSKCMQYDLGCQIEQLSSEELFYWEGNRRKHIRIEKDYTVTLVKLIPTGSVATHISTAHTLDISMGGMRLLLDEELPKETLMKFSFGNKHPAPIKQGVGKIQWCRAAEETDLFQAGLAMFPDGDKGLVIE